MKPAFQNLGIDCWRHAGRRLGIADECIRLQASGEACDVLLLAIDELIAEGPPAKRLLTLRPSGRQAKTSDSQLRLVLSAESDELQQMSLNAGGGMAIFEFTPTGIHDFREAVVCWQKGGEDCSIQPHSERRRKPKLGAKDLSSGEVWFWTPNMLP